MNREINRWINSIILAFIIGFIAKKSISTAIASTAIAILAFHQIYVLEK